MVSRSTVSVPCDPTPLARSHFLRAAQRLSPGRTYGLRPGQPAPPLGLTVMQGQPVLPAIDVTALPGRRGRVTAQPTRPSLPSVESIYTAFGRFTEGRMTLATFPSGCVEPLGGFPVVWEITSEGAARIRAGEREHCRDLQLIQDVMDHWAALISRYLVGRRFRDEAAVLRVARARHIPSTSEMADIIRSLITVFNDRDDRGYHHGPAVPGRWFTPGSRCSITIRVGGGCLPRVGQLSSAALFASCGAPEAVLRRYR